MQLVSDETWNRLDPGAGRVSPTTRRRIGIGVVGALLAVSLVGGVWWTGVLVPHVGLVKGGGYSVDSSRHAFTVMVQLTNDGVSGEHLRVGRSGRGLQLTGPDLPDGGLLAAGASVEVVLRYRVTDCAASGARVQAGDWPIPVTVRRPWGATTVHLVFPEALRDALGGPTAAPWQQELARLACRPA